MSFPDYYVTQKLKCYSSMNLKYAHRNVRFRNSSSSNRKTIETITHGILIFLPELPGCVVGGLGVSLTITASNPVSN